MGDTVKAALLAATAILTTVLEAIVGFARLGDLDPGERYLFIALSALAFALVIMYWALTPPDRVRKRIALALLLLVAATAVTIIWFSATYHNITVDVYRTPTGATYVISAARTPADLKITATTRSPATIQIGDYVLNSGNQMPLPDDAIQEINDTLVVTGFRRPQVLTIPYDVAPPDAPITFVPGGIAGTLVWMSDSRTLRLHAALLGGFLWFLFAVTLHWCSRSSLFKLPAHEPPGFRPPPTPMEDESSKPAPTKGSTPK
jgi:hypothetical protein